MNEKTADPTDPESYFTGPCGLLRRLASMLYDGLLVVALLMVAAGVAVVASGQEIRSGTFWFQAYLLVAWWAYFAVCWRLKGQTVGMKAWRIHLVTDTQQPIGWARAAIRFGLALVSAAMLGLGFLWSLFDPSRRCWHDIGSASRLMVAAKSPARNP